MGGGAQPGAKLTRWGAVVAIIKCNWGIGMMAMPYMLLQAGPIAGVLMFFGSMVVTQFSILNLLAVKRAVAAPTADHTMAHDTASTPLLRSWESGSVQVEEERTPPPKSSSEESLDYTEVIRRALGTTGEWVAVFSIFLASYGSNIAYLKFIGDNMFKFFPHALPDSALWIWLACIPLCLLAWFDSVGFLAPASVVGLTSALAFAVVVVYNAVHSMSPDHFYAQIHDAPVFEPATFPLALSIAAFCNEGIVVLTPSTQSAMIQPDKYAWTCWWGICYFIVCYMSVGISGYALYNAQGIKGDMSLNFTPSSNKLYSTAAVLYCIQLVPTYAIVYFVAYESLEGKYFRLTGITAPRELHLQDRRKTKLVAFANRCAWIFVSGLVALEVPHFGDFLGLIGALGNSAAIYVMPQIAYILIIPAERDSAGKMIWSALARRGFSALVALFGIGLAIIGTYQSIDKMFFTHATNTTTTASATVLKIDDFSSAL